MNGVLVLDKPTGPTSFDVVREVRLALHVDKAGHTGTLDPLASGVLPICLGEATKVAGYLTAGDKSYQARLKLGVETDTLDAEGRVVRVTPVSGITEEVLRRTLSQFLGARLQVPPMYSAVRVGGKRLYEIARAGNTIERQPRDVTLYSLQLDSFAGDEVLVSLRCSKGFFVRVLAEEIGKVLECGAHLTALRRTGSGCFTLEQAVALAEINGPSGRTVAEKNLIPMAAALVEIPAVHLTERDAARVRHGAPLRLEGKNGRVRLLSASGALLAIAEVTNPSPIKYLRVFNESSP